MEKVKRKVTLPQQISIIEYKAWQVPRFQILKASMYSVIEILKKNLKMRVIKSCYNLHQNF